MTRKRIPSRLASQLKQIQTLAKKVPEQKRAERAAARVKRLELKVQEAKLRKEARIVGMVKPAVRRLDEKVEAIRRVREVIDAREAAKAPPAEYVTESRTDGQGNTTTKLAIDPRTGEPLKAHPTPQPKKPAEPAKPMTRVEEMRAKYVAHHQNATAGVGGFANPFGIVSHNRMVEGGGATVKVCRGLVPWR